MNAIPAHPHIPQLQQGVGAPAVAAAGSARNLCQWLDAVVAENSPHSSRPINVRTGLPKPGHYAGLWGPEWEDARTFMGVPTGWIAALDTLGISCGSLTVAFGRTGRDCSRLVATQVGPFLT